MNAVKNNDEILLRAAKEVFFKAMRAGYAGDGNAVKTKSTDGKVSIKFRDGEYRVLDVYYVTPHSSSSFGTTVIFYKNDPIWFMSYGGSYPKEVIPFLKDALKRSYEADLFVGGRGSKVFSDNLVYENTVEVGDFTRFKGHECIHNVRSGSLIGYHEYWGMSLLQSVCSCV